MRPEQQDPKLYIMKLTIAASFVYCIKRILNVIMWARRQEDCWGKSWPTDQKKAFYSLRWDHLPGLQWVGRVERILSPSSTL